LGLDDAELYNLRGQSLLPNGSDQTKPGIIWMQADLHTS